jgi:energy-converting hydrogenase Eha subunit E
VLAHNYNVMIHDQMHCTFLLFAQVCDSNVIMVWLELPATSVSLSHIAYTHLL